MVCIELFQLILYYSQFNSFIGKSVHETLILKTQGQSRNFCLKGASGRMEGTRKV